MHSHLAPSSAHRWPHCFGSVSLAQSIPPTSNPAADEGTAAHLLAAQALNENQDANKYLGLTFLINGKGWQVTQDMAAHVQKYLDFIRAIDGKLLLVEQRLSIEHFTKEKDSAGTADAIILTGDEIIIVDLKYGLGVKVHAAGNPQLLMYASAAMLEYKNTGNYKTVRTIIIQPRLNHISEAVLTVSELRVFAENIMAKAELAIPFIDITPEQVALSDLNPGENQCRFCPAKAICPALTNRVLTTVVGKSYDPSIPANEQLATANFNNINLANLGNVAETIALTKGWLKAVETLTQRILQAGGDVSGLKGVIGGQGNRKWDNTAEVEQILRGCGLEETVIFEQEMVSPTAIEKLYKKGLISKEAWDELQANIKRNQGAFIVVPENDPRPSASNAVTVEDFKRVASNK